MTIQKPKTATACIVALGMSTFAVAAQAKDVDCGTPYTVRSGDSLSQIAKDAYGSAGNFSLIYTANSSAIGSNPGLIRIGMELDIPCLDDALAESTADADAIKQVSTTESLPAPKADMIRVVQTRRPLTKTCLAKPFAVPQGIPLSCLKSTTWSNLT